ncbi:uncharacterized protein G2W53_002183 [Senna tora]|uniref:Uncharacterized protein n=1 Tax=Senna tora TaxID=362788 RepID=A0A834XL96_9FABA|nr:uncharacterized protein G2W53_002183 [Senna tora]
MKQKQEHQNSSQKLQWNRLNLCAGILEEWFFLTTIWPPQAIAMKGMAATTRTHSVGSNENEKTIVEIIDQLKKKCSRRMFRVQEERLRFGLC